MIDRHVRQRVNRSDYRRTISCDEMSRSIKIETYPEIEIYLPSGLYRNSIYVGITINNEKRFISEKYFDENEKIIEFSALGYCRYYEKTKDFQELIEFDLRLDKILFEEIYNSMEKIDLISFNIFGNDLKDHAPYDDNDSGLFWSGRLLYITGFSYFHSFNNHEFRTRPAP